MIHNWKKTERYNKVRWQMGGYVNKDIRSKVNELAKEIEKYLANKKSKS